MHSLLVGSSMCLMPIPNHWCTKGHYSLNLIDLNEKKKKKDVQAPRPNLISIGPGGFARIPCHSNITPPTQCARLEYFHDYEHLGLSSPSGFRSSRPVRSRHSNHMRPNALTTASHRSYSHAHRTIRYLISNAPTRVLGPRE